MRAFRTESIYGWSQNNRRCIIGKKHGHDGSDDIDQIEEATRRTIRCMYSMRRKPIEDAFCPREFSQKHHAGEEKVNVRTLEDSPSGLRNRHEGRTARSNTAPAQAQIASGNFHGRRRTPAIVAPVMSHTGHAVMPATIPARPQKAHNDGDSVVTLSQLHVSVQALA